MDLPIIEFKLTDDVEGLQAIAFVDTPAIGLNYQAFNKSQKFEVVNEEQRIVMGPAMIPDLPIFRRDESGEYYALFKKNTIKALVQKLFKDNKHTTFNEQHNSFQILEGVYIYQSFITDAQLGISAPKGFENVADGTWFIAAKVENDDAWAKVKEEGLLNGFSVEGVFDLEPYKFKNQINKMSKINLESVISTLKSVFADAEVETEVVETFGEATLVDGTIVKWDGELAEGSALLVVSPEGDVSAPDGVHEFEDGTVIETAGGLVLSIKTVGAEEAPAVEEDEFTAEMLDSLIEKAMSKYAAEFTASLAAITEQNESFKSQLASVLESKAEMKKEFSATLEKVGVELDAIAKSEEPTAGKPREFSVETRAEKAARVGALLRASK